MGDGRWEDGAHSLDQLSSGAIEAEVGLDDDEEAVEAAEAAEAAEVTTAPASILLLSQVSGLYPRLREPK